MTHKPIVTITLNPALDFATDVAKMHDGEKLRCDRPSMFPGGGGVNVARAIWNLGGHVRACVALGGPNGNALELLLRAEGVDVLPVRIDVQTRHSLSVREETTNKLYRFMLPGTEWTQMIEANFLAEATKAVADADYCVLSGSMPPGTDATTIRKLATICHNANCQLFVDTSGPTLRALTQVERMGVDILRMDEEEAQASTDQHLETLQDFVSASKRMLDQGAADVIVMGLGATGNLAVPRVGDTIFCPNPKVKMVSRVGAGDSFVGGMTLSLARGSTLADALRYGTAAASVAVTKPGTELCALEETDAMAASLNVDVLQ
ncbi:MAG: 1-phosphofructokinase family hexose kinase [Pseudomonadota bacterium]